MVTSPKLGSMHDGEIEERVQHAVRAGKQQRSHTQKKKIEAQHTLHLHEPSQPHNATPTSHSPSFAPDSRNPQGWGLTNLPAGRLHCSIHRSIEIDCLQSVAKLQDSHDRQGSKKNRQNVDSTRQTTRTEDARQQFRAQRKCSYSVEPALLQATVHSSRIFLLRMGLASYR